jgi:hypothetical protein
MSEQKGGSVQPLQNKAAFHMAVWYMKQYYVAQEVDLCRLALRGCILHMRMGYVCPEDIAVAIKKPLNEDLLAGFCRHFDIDYHRYVNIVDRFLEKQKQTEPSP